MTSSLPLGWILTAGVPVYRLANFSHYPPNTPNPNAVVDGQGPVHSQTPGRYNGVGAPTIYLSEKPETAIAEGAFYCHKGLLELIDQHPVGVVPTPSTSRLYVLWEIRFRNDITNIADLTPPGAPSAHFIYPSLIDSPYQDYQHLQERRQAIQRGGYAGIRVRSSRDTTHGNNLVLFHSQSGNVASIVPCPIEFRLITPVGTPFQNLLNDELDYQRVQINAMPQTSPPNPSWAHFVGWQRFVFRR